MNGRDCEWVRDHLPDMVACSLPPEDVQEMGGHLEGCPECREELEVIRLLRDSALREAQVPPGLADEIKARIRRPQVVSMLGRRPWAPAWVLSAAAVLVLALGISVVWSNRAPGTTQDPIVVALQEPLPESWLWDDGVVAGAPVLDGLSDEDLEALLEELEG